MPKPRSTRFQIGEPVPRYEDMRFLRGKGRYVDDLELPGAARAVFVRAQHGNARIRGIDTSDARDAPGVLAVLTARDWYAEDKGRLSVMYAVPSTDGTPMRERSRPVFANELVCHAGDPIALVVAETEHAALDAVERVIVDEDPREAVADVVTAVAPDAPLVHEDFGTNVAYDWEVGDRRAVNQRFQNTAHQVELEVSNNRIYGFTIEPRSVVGRYDAADDSYTLWSTTQMPHVIRDCLAEDSLRVPAHRIRVVAPDVGGGFGLKGSHFAEEAAVLWASRRLGRAVRWTATRTESFVSDVHARDQFARARLAVDDSGRVQALDVDVLANLGAYASLFGAGCASVFGSGAICGPYDFPVACFRVRGVYTHTVPTEAYRGAGMPEATNVIERLMEAAARELGMDPFEFRRRNLLESHREPIVNALGVPHDSGSYIQTLDLLEQSYRQWRERQCEELSRNIGIGIASYVMQASGGPSREGAGVGSRLSNWEHVRVSVHPGGQVTVSCGSHCHGQGHETVFRQLISTRLGCAPDEVEIVYGDTAKVHGGLGTYASRALVIAGSAISEASDRVIEKGRTLAAHMLECAVPDVDFEDGVFRVVGTDRALGFRDIAAAAYRGGDWPPGFAPGLDETCYVDPSLGTTPSGFHLCVVEVDAETGQLQLLDYLTADDFGRIINPLIVEGQVHGALAQGLGQALSECCVYDGEAQLLSGSAMDYGIPRAADMPDISQRRTETAAPCNPLGVKGMGEACTLPAPPALANALQDALPAGSSPLPPMPFTAARLWRVFQSAI